MQYIKEAYEKIQVLSKYERTMIDIILLMKIWNTSYKTLRIIKNK